MQGVSYHHDRFTLVLADFATWTGRLHCGYPPSRVCFVPKSQQRHIAVSPAALPHLLGATAWLDCAGMCFAVPDWALPADNILIPPPLGCVIADAWVWLSWNANKVSEVQGDGGLALGNMPFGCYAATVSGRLTRKPAGTLTCRASRQAHLGDS